MGFIGFLFVLAIVIPLAVLMIYLINNLNSDMKKFGKEKETADANANGAKPARERTERTRRRDDAERGRYRADRPYPGKKQEGEDGDKRKTAKKEKQPSKRKRRKERRNRRKNREEKK